MMDEKNCRYLFFNEYFLELKSCTEFQRKMNSLK